MNSVSELENSSTFCILPWMHARIGQDGKVFPCCKMNAFYEYGSVKQSSLEQVLNDEPARALRLKMLAGKPNPLCSSCYMTEAAGSQSMRSLMNERYRAELPKALETATDGSVREVELLYIDLRFSNTCNLRCRSCGPQNSTAWYADARKLTETAPSETLRAFADTEALITTLDSSLKNVNLIYFAGGEPLLDEQHYAVLDHLIKTGRTDVELDYNTNFSNLQFKDHDLIALWNQFPRVTVGASLDGAGESVEFLRKGISWERVRANHARLRSEAPHVKFLVYSTVSALNVFDLPRAFEVFMNEGMVTSLDSFGINVVTDPAYLGLDVLNEAEREKLRQQYGDFFARARLQWGEARAVHLEKEFGQVFEHLNKPVNFRERARFRTHTLRLDQIRQERSFLIYPELFELLSGSL